MNNIFVVSYRQEMRILNVKTNKKIDGYFIFDQTKLSRVTVWIGHWHRWIEYAYSSFKEDFCIVYFGYFAGKLGVALH